MREKMIDPCKKCPILKGETDIERTPCQDENGHFLGLMIVTPFACKYAIKKLNLK